MGAQGTATVNFGVFPGASDASVAITGQTAILGGSLVEAWLSPSATADHTEDEPRLETLECFVGPPVAGSGFMIYLVNSSQLTENPAMGGGRGGNPGAGTRIFGAWNVNWVWN